MFLRSRKKSSWTTQQPQSLDPRKQKGLGLVAAIFVITVMALIAVGISNLVVTGQQSYGHEVLSVRAFLAAESGAQLTVNAVIPPSGASTCAATSTETFTVEGLNGCSALMSCSQIGPIDGITYYDISSEGRCGSGADQAIRRVVLRVQE